MFGTSASFVPFVAEDEEDTIDPVLIPHENVAEEDLIDEDPLPDEDLETSEEEEEFDEEM